MVIYETTFHSTFELVDEKAKEALMMLKAREIDWMSHTLFKINFVLRELLNNAVEHGNAFDPQKQVFLRIESKDQLFIFTVRDEGAGICTELTPTDEGATEKLPRHDKAYHAICANETLERLKHSTDDTETDVDALADRRRGLETIKRLAFELTITGNTVVATLDLSKEAMQ
ncbi:MAG: serine/threonine-protein kinase RsbW [Clostridiales bacterium]|jgi:light-regulated signal transduction histidine kinase (bacteriophytochrome)|nr:serine/threonine-protein kinase RsbW [Clostridiales bacterium]MDN5299001.1 serine/threonine-protein kinase RsbW [Clostridiales bacterium]